MSYYQPQAGDYYPRGDPGFLSSLWKGAKAIGKAIIGIPAKQPIPTAVAGGIIGQQAYNLVMPGGTPAGTAVQTVPQNGGMAMNGCCAAGYHPDKRTGTRCVRNRRMDVCNAKALRRSMRRVQGFEKLAKRTIQFTRRVKLKK